MEKSELEIIKEQLNKMKDIFSMIFNHLKDEWEEDWCKNLGVVMGDLNVTLSKLNKRIDSWVSSYSNNPISTIKSNKNKEVKMVGIKGKSGRKKGSKNKKNKEKTKDEDEEIEGGAIEVPVIMS